MKKLIVTCTAVAYGIAFIGCGGGGADTESLPEGENEAGDEVGTTDGGDLEGGGTDPVAGPAGGGSEE